MSDFKNNIKVEPNQLNKNIEIIKELNKQEKIYNSNSDETSRINVLRSGENVFFNIMLISGMLFVLNDTSQSIIDASVTGRIKSMESIDKKEHRANRGNKQIKDIIAYNLIINRIHNSDDFYSAFISNKVQSLYNERKSNINLMQMVVDFINSFDMYDLSSELDESLTVQETKEVSKERLKGMKDNCAIIADNIKKYNREDPIASEGIPISQSMRVICEELLKKEIDKAIKGLYKEKNDLEAEIKAAKNDKTISEDMLKIKRSNVNSLRKKLTMLNSKENWNTEELIELLSGKIDKEKVELYIPIIEQLKKEEIDEMVSEKNRIKDISNEKIYCQLFILVLYQLAKLEFVKDEQYEGLIYNNIWSNLHNLLKEYKNCEIEHGTYGNITFESLQKLTINLIRLNARLSDQLQFEIAKYEMEYHLKPIIKQFTGTDNLEGEEKIKPNGYVSIHYDADSFEIKVTTHYRDRVASKGSAAYGSGRIENKSEKKREIKKLNYQKYQLKIADKESVPAVKNAKKGIEFAKKMEQFRNLNQGKVFVSDSSKEYGLMKWKTDLLKGVPRYFVAKYDGNVVKIEFFSELQNVEKYYSETSVIQVREEVKKKLGQIQEEGLRRHELGHRKILTDEPYVIEISRSKYRDFLHYELVEMKNKIEHKLEKAEEITQNGDVHEEVRYNQ